MAVKPVDRIRTMITDLERGARTLGDDIRKRAGNVTVTSELEQALRQLLVGLTTIAAQLEKAAGELRRYFEEAGTASGKGKKGKGAKRKAGTKKAAAKKAAPKAKKAPAAKAEAKKPSKGEKAEKKAAPKAAAKKTASKKSPR